MKNENLKPNSNTMKKTIQAFLDTKQVAIAGASNNRDNFGRFLMKELSARNYEVYPVNPHCEEIDGIPCAAKVKELPEGIENLILVVPPSLTDEIIELYHALKKEKESFNELGIDFEEKAFYDTLKALTLKYDFEYPDEKLITLSKK